MVPVLMEADRAVGDFLWQLFFSGMICLRDGGTQMPDMIRRYSNKGVYTFYQIFCSLLLLLVGAVFIYTPGDIAAT